MSIPGLARYLDSIERVGPRVIADWSGDERAVPSVAEDRVAWLEIDSYDEERLRQEAAIRRQQNEGRRRMLSRRWRPAVGRLRADDPGGQR